MAGVAHTQTHTRTHTHTHTHTIIPNAPLVLEDVEADAAEAVDVGVVDLCQEPHLFDLKKTKRETANQGESQRISIGEPPATSDSASQPERNDNGKPLASPHSTTPA